MIKNGMKHASSNNDNVDDFAIQLCKVVASWCARGKTCQHWKTGLFLFESSSKTHKVGEMQEATVRLIAVTVRVPWMRTVIVSAIAIDE